MSQTIWDELVGLAEKSEKISLTSDFSIGTLWAKNRLQLFQSLLDGIKTIDRINDLGDAIYNVRDRELQGWEGPLVTEYGQAVKNVRETIKKLEAP